MNLFQLIALGFALLTPLARAEAQEPSIHCPERVRAQASVNQLDTQIQDSGFSGNEINLAASYTGAGCRIISIMGDRLEKFGRIEHGLGVGVGQRISSKITIETELWRATTDPAVLPQYRGLLGLRAYPKSWAEVALTSTYRHYESNDLLMLVASADFQFSPALWLGSTAYLGRVSSDHPTTTTSTIVVRSKWMLVSEHSFSVYYSRGDEALMNPESMELDLRVHDVTGASFRYQLRENFFLDAAASYDATTDHQFRERRWTLSVGGWH